MLKTRVSPLLLLPVTLLLTGCPPKLETPTTATGQEPRSCKVWSQGPHVSWASKHDQLSPETKASIDNVNHWMDGNNAAQSNYCPIKETK